MRPVIWFLLGAIAAPVLLGLTGLVYVKTMAHGFSARTKPLSIEKFAATQARLMVIPANGKNLVNPVPNSKEVIAEGRAHWADHCATCHANNGSGQTEMGRNLYPPAPDMRKRETQEMTDGELFYAIENGIRLSGMPAWGSDADHDKTASWNLVRFIRHLPNLTLEEISAMEKLNPKTPEERQEEQEEEQFLNGRSSNPSHSTIQHHH